MFFVAILMALSIVFFILACFFLAYRKDDIGINAIEFLIVAILFAVLAWFTLQGVAAYA